MNGLFDVYADLSSISSADWTNSQLGPVMWSDNSLYDVIITASTTGTTLTIPVNNPDNILDGDIRVMNSLVLTSGNLTITGGMIDTYALDVQSTSATLILESGFYFDQNTGLNNLRQINNAGTLIFAKSIRLNNVTLTGSGVINMLGTNSFDWTGASIVNQTITNASQITLNSGTFNGKIIGGAYSTLAGEHLTHSGLSMITINGGTYNNDIIGGGYAKEASSSSTLTGTTGITIKGGHIGAITINGGGQSENVASGVSVSGSSTITLDGAISSINNGAIIRGGNASGGSTITLQNITAGSALANYTGTIYAGIATGTGIMHSLNLIDVNATLNATLSGNFTNLNINGTTTGTTTLNTLVGKSIIIQPTRTLNVNLDTADLDYTLAQMSISGTLQKSGSKILTLRGTILGTGNFLVSEGTLDLSKASLVGNGNYTVESQGKLSTLALTIASGKSLINAGTVNTTGAITVNTGGTINNSGTLAATGTTTVNSGGSLNNTGTLTGAVTVNSGGTLKGDGTITGATQINAGATLIVGNSPGNPTYSNLSLKAGSNMSFSIDGDANATDLQYNGILGADYSSLIITDAFNLTSGTVFTLELSSTFLTEAYAAALANGPSALEDYATLDLIVFNVTDLSKVTFGSLNLKTSTLDSINAGLNSLIITHIQLEDPTFSFEKEIFYKIIKENGTERYILQAQMSVPEPSTATLGLIALAGLMARRRRKQA